MHSKKVFRPLRSLLEVGPAHPFRGGLSSFNHSLAYTFQQMGIACRLFTFTTQYPSLLFPGSSQFSSEAAPKGLDITRTLSSINPISWIRTGLKIRRERPEAIIIRYWIPVMAPAFGTVCRIARWSGVRTMALLDNVIPHEPRPFDRLLTRYFISSIDGFIYMSDQVYRDLRLFTPNKPALFSPHPMFTSYGDPMPREDACKALKLDPTLRYTMFFGYIRDYKGLDLLLDAWAQLQQQSERYANHRLIIAGEYYSGRERYAEQIDRLGIRNRLVMMDHYLSDAQVGQLFSAVDLVVQPYRSATQSGVTQVAYWFDVPMVVTDVGGLRELVPDSEVGYVVQPNPEAIAAAIARFFTEQQQNRFKENILRYRERFTWEQMAENFKKLYQMICDSSDNKAK